MADSAKSVSTPKWLALTLVQHYSDRQPELQAMAPGGTPGGECHREYGLGSPVTNEKGGIIGKIREHRCCERSSIIIYFRLFIHQDLWC